MGNVIIELQTGRRIVFDEVVALDRKTGTWLRCVRSEPSSREDLPETTKYYHLASDVERIRQQPPS